MIESHVQLVHLSPTLSPAGRDALAPYGKDRPKRGSVPAEQAIARIRSSDFSGQVSIDVYPGRDRKRAVEFLALIASLLDGPSEVVCYHHCDRRGAVNEHFWLYPNSIVLEPKEELRLAA